MNQKLEVIIREIRWRLDVFDNPFVAWTGGKDSTLLLWLVRKALGHSVPAIFLDSFDEFPEVYQFISKIAHEWGVPVYRTGYEAKTAESAQINKILALKRAVKLTGCNLLFVGIRKDENEARSKAKPLEWRGGIRRSHPLLDLTESEVWGIIREEKIPYCPLYDQGYRSLGEKSFTKKSTLSERSGRDQQKEKRMKRLRQLGYF